MVPFVASNSIRITVVVLLLLFLLLLLYIFVAYVLVAALCMLTRGLLNCTALHIIIIFARCHLPAVGFSLGPLLQSVASGMDDASAPAARAPAATAHPPVAKRSKVAAAEVDEAFTKLHDQGYAVLHKAFGLHRCRQLLKAVAREDYSGGAIFNGEAVGAEPRRFHARGESWAPSVERELERALQTHGLLTCSEGHGSKSVADLHALKSVPYASSGARADEAALRGRQPAHMDASESTAKERRAHGLQPLSKLSNEDMPLSAMLAVQPGTMANGRQGCVHSQHPTH